MSEQESPRPFVIVYCVEEEIFAWLKTRKARKRLRRAQTALADREAGSRPSKSSD
jgi:hypothetical protein